MDRLIELVRRSNIDHFEYDLREFAESPQVAIYKSSDSGHFACTPILTAVLPPESEGSPLYYN